MSSKFTIPGTAGEGELLVFVGSTEPGSVGDGRYDYEYHLLLGNVSGNGGCIEAMSIKLGTLETFDLDGDGTSGEQVYLRFPSPDPHYRVPVLATRNGPFVRFWFYGKGVCPRDNSVAIGVLAPSPPIVTLVELEGSFDGSLQVGGLTPNLLPKLKYRFTLLYDTIATLPPGGFIAPPSMKAGEGYRRAMLNDVNAALEHAEEGRILPAVQLLQHLLLRTDGDGDDWVQDDPETRENEQTNLALILSELIEELADRDTEDVRRHR